MRTHEQLSCVGATPPALVAQRVYARRRVTLVRPVSMVPVLLGCLVLSGTIGVSLSAPGAETIKPRIEALRPGNAETVWKHEVAAPPGPTVQITLDLRNRLVGKEARTQRVLWQQLLPPVAASSAPAVFADRQQVFVAVAAANGTVVLLSATSGQIAWTQQLSERVEVSPLPIAHAGLAVACADGRIYGLNLQTGAVEYMTETDSRIAALEPVADGEGEQFYAVADSRRVLALNARTGNLQWGRDTFGTVSDRPLVAAGNVIAPTSEGGDSKLWAFDESGDLKWMNTFGRYSNLAAAEDYIAMTHGSLVTLIQATTGEPVHYWQLAESPDELSLERQGNRLIVRTDQEILTTVLN